MAMGASKETYWAPPNIRMEEYYNWHLTISIFAIEKYFLKKEEKLKNLIWRT